jgi:hypothetical protein
MLIKTKIALAALLLAASAAGASAQSAGGYEPDGNGQGLWKRAERPAAQPAGVHAPVIHPGPNVVIENGQYLGQDPDPNVRLMLERDLSWQGF